MTDHGQANARAWLENMREMLTALREAEESGDDRAAETARERIEESPLSIQIRDGWRAPGANSDGPEEYEILLTTGGPALRIVGDLDQSEPDTARLQYRDWGTPWTDYRAEPSAEDVALRFAQVFYFGE
jgi:hypothetical protein